MAEPINLDRFRRKKAGGGEQDAKAPEPEPKPPVELRPRSERMTPEQDLVDRRAFVEMLGDYVEGKPGVAEALGFGSGNVKKSAGVYSELVQSYNEDELRTNYREAKRMNTRPAFLQALQDEAKRRGILLY
ncbi:MAG: hypothetical protein AAB573_00855 [Patescibacteria group bacterium]